MPLRDLYETYHQQLQFMVIYIQEAHPVDGWWFGDNFVGWLLRRKRSKAAMDIYDPTTMEERQAVAHRCTDTLAYVITTRIYLIGLDGDVIYASEPGPWGFKPSQLQKAIRQTLQIGSG